MTRDQQQADRELESAKGKWLLAYGWTQEGNSKRWTHPNMPKARESYTTGDAIAMTNAEKLRYGGPR